MASPSIVPSSGQVTQNAAQAPGVNWRKGAKWRKWDLHVHSPASQNFAGDWKPCIKGSDSHNVNDELGKLKDHLSKPTDKYCWIKADPTFNGLRQIINEPADRVYIGRLPPKMDEVHGNPTRYISEARIRKSGDGESGDV
jgi:hypothetical protein